MRFAGWACIELQLPITMTNHLRIRGLRIRGHPLEISGQADKGNSPRYFHQALLIHEPHLFAYLNASKNLTVWRRLICTSHPSELRRLPIVKYRYLRLFACCLRNYLAPYTRPSPQTSFFAKMYQNNFDNMICNL